MKRYELAAKELRSLCWAGDDLIYWIGGVRIGRDGKPQRFGCGESYRFDAAVGSGEVGVMFEMLGTKGRIGRWNGELPRDHFVPIGFTELREIDRSYYHAAAYGYPVCVFALPDGREAIAHCPRRHDTLEIELVDGTPLTRRDVPAEDVFHGRLAASQDGRWLLSNGWVWQPYNVACVYDVARCLVEPAHLSTAGLTLDLGPLEAEVDAATLSGDRLIASASAERPGLSIVELPSGKHLGYAELPEYLGQRIMAWGAGHIVAFDGHPRVVRLDGPRAAIVHVWEDLEVPSWSQPNVNLAPPTAPYLAIDPKRARFAIADGDRVVVIAAQP